MEAILQLYRRYERVTYYTVSVEGKTYTEFDDFLHKIVQKPERNKELEHLVHFLGKVGGVGAHDRFFKDEDSASRFMPWNKKFVSEFNYFGLRLYCLKINERIVIIFNGCEKTAQVVKNCRNCSMIFREANQFARKIQQAIRDGDITVESDRLIFEHDFILN